MNTARFATVVTAFSIFLTAQSSYSAENDLSDIK